MTRLFEISFRVSIGVEAVDDEAARDAAMDLLSQHCEQMLDCPAVQYSTFEAERHRETVQ